MERDSENVVILLAHPNIVESQANKELINSVKDKGLVQVYNLYEKPDLLFEPAEWSRILTEAAALVFQFPIYWASAPHMLKRWLDEIFTHLAKTPAVVGKPLMIVTTTGSEFNAYRSGGRNKFTMDELLRPYQVAAIHSGMRWVTPLVIYGTGLEDPARRIAEGAIEYKNRIDKLIDYSNMTNKLDW